MAIGAIMVCEGSAPSYDDFVTHIRSRLHLLPRLRQKLAVPPGHMGTPMWVDDPDFDVHKHVQGHDPAPSPGTDAQFHEVIGEYLAATGSLQVALRVLAHRRLREDDRFGDHLQDPPRPRRRDRRDRRRHPALRRRAQDEIVRTEEPWHPQEPPTGRHLLGLSVRGFFGMFGGAARWLWSAAKAPGKAWRRLSDGVVGLWEVGWNLTKPAPKVAFNCRDRAEQALPWTTGPLGDFKTIKNALGGTVNDVTLAVAGGALRRWLEARDVDADQLALQALVPVSVRTENEHGELGNRLTAMRGPLPVHIADPYQRLQYVTREMEELEGSEAGARRGSDLGPQSTGSASSPPVLR